MAKITTDDCKEFLVTFFQKHPEIIETIYGDMEEVYGEDAFDLTAVLKKNNWKRMWKMNAKNTMDDWCMRSDSEEKDAFFYVFENDDTAVFSYEPTGKILLKDVAYGRGFECVPFDCGVRYIVLEDKNGKLYVGEYIGD